MPKVRKGDHYNSPFAQNLRALIDEKGTKQKELGDAIGVSRQTISLYADGSTQPSPDKLSLIADYYNVSADYLLGRVGVKTMDVELQQVCEYTGLSEGAVKSLRNICLYYSKEASCLSVMIEDSNFIDLLRAIQIHVSKFGSEEAEPQSEDIANIATALDCTWDNARRFLKTSSRSLVNTIFAAIIKEIEKSQRQKKQDH